VWIDPNRNGVQDPNEKGVDGLILTLHDMSNGGVKVATDTTANGGQYYFNDSNVPGKLKRGNNYEVRMSTGQNFIPTPKAIALGDTLQLSPKNTVGMLEPNLSDSDGSYNSDSSTIVIAVKTGQNSENDHNADIGLMGILPPDIHPNDLELHKIVVGDCKRKIGDEVTFKLFVKNVSTDPLAIADSIYVEDILAGNFTFISATAKQGIYNATTKLWGPIKLKTGESDTLTMKVKVNSSAGFEGGTVCNIAEIKSMVGDEDPDSSPGNGNKIEDDYALACVSVPIKICEARKDTIIISAPTGYTKYQWFRNGTKIDGATASTLEVGQAGDYSVEVEAQGCPAKNCCPAYVINDCECPEEICVPFVIKKTKSKGIPIK